MIEWTTTLLVHRSIMLNPDAGQRRRVSGRPAVRHCRARGIVNSSNSGRLCYGLRLLALLTLFCL